MTPPNTLQIVNNRTLMVQTNHKRLCQLSINGPGLSASGLSGQIVYNYTVNAKEWLTPEHFRKSLMWLQSIDPQATKEELYNAFYNNALLLSDNVELLIHLATLNELVPQQPQEESQ